MIEKLKPTGEHEYVYVVSYHVKASSDHVFKSVKGACDFIAKIILKVINWPDWRKEKVLKKLTNIVEGCTHPYLDEYYKRNGSSLTLKKHRLKP